MFSFFKNKKKPVYCSVIHSFNHDVFSTDLFLAIKSFIEDHDMKLDTYDVDYDGFNKPPLFEETTVMPNDLINVESVSFFKKSEIHNHKRGMDIHFFHVGITKLIYIQSYNHIALDLIYNHLKQNFKIDYGYSYIGYLDIYPYFYSMGSGRTEDVKDSNSKGNGEYLSQYYKEIIQKNYIRSIYTSNILNSNQIHNQLNNGLSLYDFIKKKNNGSIVQLDEETFCWNIEREQLQVIREELGNENFIISNYINKR